MVSTILRDYTIKGTTLGTSLYVIFDTTTKTLMEAELGCQFNKKKHIVRAQVSINSKGKRFIAMWFEKKK